MDLLSRLVSDYPQFSFELGKQLCWSPRKKTVFYVDAADEAGLVHETSHALLGHTTYATDIALLRKETEAWQKARDLAEHYGITLDDEHIQECLDSYREWLHKRSTCPACGSHGLQATERRYSCPNCKSTWEVSSARFCRPYRRKMAQKA